MTLIDIKAGEFDRLIDSIVYIWLFPHLINDVLAIKPCLYANILKAIVEH
jgi:hypothetical protein